MVLSAAIVLIYKAVALFNLPYTGGGASMWPVALFFIAVYAAGSALGMVIANAVRKGKQ